MPKTAEQERRLAGDPRAHWFTVVFDREGYSPELFEAMRQKRIAILSYHKCPEDDWRPEEFTTHTVRLAAGARGDDATGRAWHAFGQKAVVARDPQTE